jgi:thiamine pyrophosphate-dependent acetolactate synthase large subunit-like protein
VLIALGMRFDDRITGTPRFSFAKQAKIIHFELDKAEVGKNVVPDLAVIGDLGETLPALVPLIEERPPPGLDSGVEGVARDSDSSRTSSTMSWKTS